MNKLQKQTCIHLDSFFNYKNVKAFKEHFLVNIFFLFIRSCPCDATLHFHRKLYRTSIMILVIMDIPFIRKIFAVKIHRIVLFIASFNTDSFAAKRNLKTSVGMSRVKRFFQIVPADNERATLKINRLAQSKTVRIKGRGFANSLYMRNEYVNLLNM